MQNLIYLNILISCALIIIFIRYMKKPLSVQGDQEAEDDEAGIPENWRLEVFHQERKLLSAGFNALNSIASLSTGCIDDCYSVPIELPYGDKIIIHITKLKKGL